jgi:two-component system sensor histidine kinase DegS
MSESKFIFIWISSSVLIVLTIVILGSAFDNPDFNKNIFIPFVVLLIIILGFVFHGYAKSDSSAEQLISKKMFDARESEKKKMAKELHDGLQQELHVITFELKQLSKKTFTPKEEMENLAEKINETIEEVRRISYALYPNQLEKLGLRKAILGIANNLADTSDVYFTIKIDEEFEKSLNLDAAIQIYRIIQELFNNVVKHSEAQRANLTMNTDKAYFYIYVSDDGQGFINNNLRMSRFRNGLGLNSIQDRLKLMNGKMEIKSQLGKGTEVKIQIPVKNIYDE